ncbi:MAG: acyltransferase [Providencia heimbachae]|nr:acyltransferase [Providencia heimbachae]
MKQEIKTLQYLRGIAALSVVFYHYRWFLNSSNQLDIPNLGDILFTSGAFGVDLFFIISGFVIILSTEKDIGLYKNSLSFTLKRIFRIYPILLFFVLISIFIKKPDLIPSIKSLIPIQLDYSSKPPYFGYNVLIVAWTLTYELFFYLIFLISMMLNHKYRGVICCFLILFMFIVTQYVFSGGITLNAYQSQNINLPVYFSAPLSLISSPMILEFCLGIVAYYIYKHTKKEDNAEREPYNIISACFILFLFIILITHTKFSGHGVLKWGLTSFLLVVSITIYEKKFNCKNYPSLLFLGSISYSIYMSHIPLLMLVNVIANYVNTTGFPLMAIAIIIVIIASTLTYFLIEKPAIKCCKKINLR